MSKEIFRYYYYLSKAFLAEYNKQETTSEEVFFFIHIPKTCGTSFRFMLYNQFHQKVIFPNLKELKQNRGKYPKWKDLMARKEDFKNHTKLLMGHYPYIVGERIFRKPVSCITFLRDPIKRTISNIQHMQRKNPSFEDASFIEVLDKMEDVQSNLQTRFLSDLPNKRPPENDRLEEAKRNLYNMSFFGIAERFSDSIELIESTFNWNLGEPLKLNQKKKGAHSPMSKELINRIEEINQLDIELYEYACELFEKRYAQIK